MKEAPSRARQLVRDGDVLVSTVRPNLNGVASVPAGLDRAIASTGFAVLRVQADRLDSRYLFHWVRTRTFIDDMVRKSTGASYPAVSDGTVKASEIPLPTLREQRRIAAFLDEADALRVKRRRTLTLLDELVDAAFFDTFGNPDTNPLGFPQVQLKDFVNQVSDGPHVSPTYVSTGVPFLSVRHVRNGSISFEDPRFVSYGDAEVMWRKCKPQRGDVVYTKGGTTGLAAAVETDRPFAVWVHLAVLKTKHDVVDYRWLATMLNTAFCHSQAQRLTRGIANRDLGLTRMVQIKMYAPPLEMQRAFSSRLADVRAVRSAAADHLAELDVLFASLQHRAFRGEL